VTTTSTSTCTGEPSSVEQRAELEVGGDEQERDEQRQREGWQQSASDEEREERDADGGGGDEVTALRGAASGLAAMGCARVGAVRPRPRAAPSP
jgi:hypothetical protein